MNRGRLVSFRPPRIAMSLAVVAIVAHVVYEVPLHSGLPFAAALVGIGGFLLMIRGWWLFRLADTAICPTTVSTSLVTHDVFSLSRNPMYLGIVLMLLGLALAVGTLPFYIALIGYFIAMDRVFCPYEEQKSLAEFGTEYESYTQCVRRWF